MKAGRLKPKCQPGVYRVLPYKSCRPPGRYAGEIQRSAGWMPIQSIRSTICAANPTLTAMLEKAYSRVKSPPMIHAISLSMDFVAKICFDRARLLKVQFARSITESSGPQYLWPGEE